MHCPLPVAVRLAIAQISQLVEYTVTWGEYTQHQYPGECRWTMVSDYRVGDVHVTSTSSRGFVVVGIEKVYERLHRLNSEISGGMSHQDFCDSVNAQEALEQILHVLEEGVKCQEEYITWLLKSGSINSRDEVEVESLP